MHLLSFKICSQITFLVSAVLHHISLLRLLPKSYFKISTFQPNFLCSSSFNVRKKRGGIILYSLFIKCFHLTFGRIPVCNKILYHAEIFDIAFIINIAPTKLNPKCKTLHLNYSVVFQLKHIWYSILHPLLLFYNTNTFQRNPNIEEKQTSVS